MTTVGGGALVRTAKDTEAASFAGMKEAYLNVRGAEAVLEAMRRCWGSLFGARTVFYRAKRGFGQADVDIAVVVQRQVDANRAGVMFTVDPATGADDRLVIEGSFGLGEAVVSGRVPPDRYVVDKRTLAVLAREIHPKPEAIEPLPGGGTAIRRLDEDEAVRPTLTDEEAREVADRGRRIELHYGRPPDTEWAYDRSGSVWMLQARPVTAAGGATPDVARPCPVRHRSYECSCAASVRPRAWRPAARACSAPWPTRPRSRRATCS